MDGIGSKDGDGDGDDEGDGYVLFRFLLTHSWRDSKYRTLVEMTFSSARGLADLEDIMKVLFRRDF